MAGRFKRRGSALFDTVGVQDLVLLDQHLSQDAVRENLRSRFVSKHIYVRSPRKWSLLDCESYKRFAQLRSSPRRFAHLKSSSNRFMPFCTCSPWGHTTRDEG